MAAPTFVTASTGTTDATGGWSHTASAPGAAGRILIVHLLQDGTLASPTITSVTNAETLAGVDNNLTFIGKFDVGAGPVAGSQHLWIGRSLSTSAMVITGANAGGDDIYVRVYEFQDVNTGTLITDVIENTTAGNTVNGAATSATVADTAVTTTDVDRLACNFGAITDDASGIALFTGATGGTWAHFQSYESASGTDGTIFFEDAAMPTAGTIDGGTDTIVSLPWGVVGFALIPVPAAAGLPPTRDPFPWMQAVNRSNVY